MVHILSKIRHITAEEKNVNCHFFADVTLFNNLFNSIKIILKNVCFFIHICFGAPCTILHSFPFTM